MNAAKEYLDEAATAMEGGRLRTAKSVLEEGLRRFPEWHLLFTYQLGAWMRSYTGDGDAARKLFEAVLEHDDRNTPTGTALPADRERAAAEDEARSNACENLTLLSASYDEYEKWARRWREIGGGLESVSQRAEVAARREKGAPWHQVLAFMAVQNQQAGLFANAASTFQLLVKCAKQMRVPREVRTAAVAGYAGCMAQQTLKCAALMQNRGGRPDPKEYKFLLVSAIDVVEEHLRLDPGDAKAQEALSGLRGFVSDLEKAGMPHGKRPGAGAPGQAGSHSDAFARWRMPCPRCGSEVEAQLEASSAECGKCGQRIPLFFALYLDWATKTRLGRWSGLLGAVLGAVLAYFLAPRGAATVWAVLGGALVGPMFLSLALYGLLRIVRPAQTTAAVAAGTSAGSSVGSRSRGPLRWETSEELETAVAATGLGGLGFKLVDVEVSDEMPCIALTFRPLGTVPSEKAHSAGLALRCVVGLTLPSVAARVEGFRIATEPKAYRIKLGHGVTMPGLEIEHGTGSLGPLQATSTEEAGEWYVQVGPMAIRVGRPAGPDPMLTRLAAGFESLKEQAVTLEA